MTDKYKDRVVDFNLPEYDATLDREISTAILQTKDNEEIELNEEGDEESQSVIDNKLLQNKILQMIEKKMIQRASIKQQDIKYKMVAQTLEKKFHQRLFDEKKRQPINYTKLSQKVFDKYAPNNNTINTVYVGMCGTTLYFGYMDQINKLPLKSPNRVDGFSRFVKILQVTPNELYMPKTFMHKSGWVNTLNRGFIKFSDFRNSDILQIKYKQIINKQMLFNPKYLIAYTKSYIKNHITQKRIYETRMYHQRMFMKEFDTPTTLQKYEIDGDKLKAIAEQSLQLLKDAKRNYETLEQFFKERIDK